MNAKKLIEEYPDMPKRILDFVLSLPVEQKYLKSSN